MGHFARANPQWRRIVDGSPALAVVTGPDAYVSPSFYATKAEHGRVVPTWNYSAVHLRGPVRIVDDPDGCAPSSASSPTTTSRAGRHPGR